MFLTVAKMSERKKQIMRKYFNTEGQCEPEEHYMVQIEERLERIKSLFVDRGKYFVINKGRQYGKTTTLRALSKYLKQEYTVVLMDFQEAGTAEFETEARFSIAFAKMFVKAFRKADINHRNEVIEPLVSFMEKFENATLMELFYRLSDICGAADKPVILIVDEVDSVSNNQVFVDFLALLRSYYIARRDTSIFHSVILAGVYDIRDLKLKLRPDEEHRLNSPWNIAAKFTVDMDFSAGQIMGMLQEYENDNHTGMNIETVAEEIYDYTSGYPYLISAICKILDEEPVIESALQNRGNIWSKEGITEAVKMILKERTSLFESMIRQISEYPDMKKMLHAILFQGETVSFNPDNQAIHLAYMFGYIVDKDGNVRVANRIFEMRLYNFFLSEDELTSAIGSAAKRNKSRFVSGGRLNMDLVLEKFVESFEDIYGDNDESFIEKYGRKFFLLYLKPIINGTGNYYIETQTRDERRTDIIVDYLGEQFVVELKIWHGDEYHKRGEKQLLEYLEYYHLNKGYMISFNFNKKKETGSKRIVINDKTIVEAVV